MRELEALNQQQQWDALFETASKLTVSAPKNAVAYGYAAHALRQLQRLEEGFEWAQRGLAIDDENLFVLNRASLLANLTRRYEVAWSLTVQNAARRPVAAADQFNLAILLVNGIHAAAQLGHIAEAVTRFTPTIEALNEPELYFNAACLYALAKDERAITWVRKSLQHGKAKDAFDDADFDGLRGDSRFEAALARDWEREKAALARAKTSDRALLTPEHFVDARKLERDGLDNDEASEELASALMADPKVADVYADWFQQRGNPRANFIRASLECERAQNEDERMLAFTRWADVLHAHGGLLLGPLVESAADTRVEWQSGFVSSMRLPSEALPLVATHPSYRLLRELRVEMPVDFAAVERAFPGLRSLSITSKKDLDVSELDLRFPQLEKLSLSADTLRVGRLLFSELRELELHASVLLPAQLAALRNVPKLEALSLVERHGSGVELANYDAMFELKSLRRLRLSMLEVDKLCARLARAQLTSQLEELDLSDSLLTEDGAESLRRHVRVFSKIRRIDVRDTMLSEETVRTLRAVLPNIVG